MAAIPVNLSIVQGTDFTADFNLKDSSGNFINLANYTVFAYMARNYTTSNRISLNAVSNLNPTEGLIRISMPDTGGSLVKKTQDLKPGRYIYNIFVNNVGLTPNIREKVIEGIIEVESSILPSSLP